MRIALWAVGLLLAATVLWLAWLVVLSRRAVRVRNAFLLRRGDARDFAWDPAHLPAGFRVERDPAPAVIAEAVAAANIDRVAGDWPRALALAEMLLRHAQDRGGIRADLATTYRRIVGGEGYCADYVRVYLAAAATAGLFCRQWSFSFDGFGGHGHTFVEIYDREHARWSFLDVFNNVYAVRGGEAPLDAIALREALMEAPREVAFRRASSGRLGYVIPEKLVDYYRAGTREWFLWWGNDIATRERRGLAGALAVLSGGLAHRLASGFMGLPALVALVTPDNEQAVASMEALRRRVGVAVAVTIALAGVLVVLAGASALDGRHA